MRIVVKNVSALLILCVLLLSACPLAGAEKNDYAEVIFGKQIKTVNMSVSAGWLGTPQLVTRNGAEGSRTALASNTVLFFINLNDDYFYQLDKDTPVLIEVEYFDEGYGSFTLTYDAIDASDKDADIIKLNNTMEWKTQEFYLEDACFANRSERRVDFKLGVYSATMKKSTEDVIFRRIRVTCPEPREMVRCGITSQEYGSVFYAGVQPELFCS